MAEAFNDLTLSADREARYAEVAAEIAHECASKTDNCTGRKECTKHSNNKATNNL